MIIWNTKTLPYSESKNNYNNPCYLVETEKYGIMLAMYMEGAWWTSYATKLIDKVIGWAAIENQNYWRNIKTGKIYTLISSAIDCTNERKGSYMVCYIGEDNILYVREASEFYDKFIRVGE